MLQLVLKEKWYNMIDEGIKKEEYRELKPYWWARVFTSPYHKMQDVKDLAEGGYNQKHHTVRFRLGYKSDAKEMIFRLNFCTIGRAKPEWAEDSMDKVIVIPLRDRLSQPALNLYNSIDKETFTYNSETDTLLDELVEFKLLTHEKTEFGEFYQKH